MEYPKCPKCNSENVYPYDEIFICPDCLYEWNQIAENEEISSNSFFVKDANGTTLLNGDTVVTIKNLPVKGTNQTIKAGTKVKNIKLIDGDHNIDCKIDGFGAIALKSEFVKKA